jgi:hypothetical protein
MYRCLPDDPLIVDMDPVQKLWLYNNWIADQNEEAELAKNHAYLLASFWNAEAVQQILGDDNVHTSTDEEFEESSKMVREQSLKLLQQKEEVSQPVRRRRRRPAPAAQPQG